MPTRKFLLDSNDICSIVAQLIARAREAGDVKPTDAVVLVGGAALCLNGIRESSGDVDLYGPERLRTHARELEAQLRPDYGPHFAIDITSERNIWGRLKLTKIDESKAVRQLSVDGQGYQLRALDAATLFVVKAEAHRQKDIDDLGLIAKHTKPDEIIERWNQIISASPDVSRFESGANLLAEISAQYLVPVSPAWIRALHLDAEDEVHLEEAFQPSMRHAAKAHGRELRP